MKKIYSKKTLSLSIFCACVLMLAFGMHKTAQALFISPDRLIIEDGQRNAEILVSNRNQNPVVVRLEWQRRVMQPNGELRLLKEGETVAGYEPADPYLRFSPRQVILKPGEHQKFRMLVRRLDGMQAGEYYSHILVREDPLQSADVDGTVKKIAENSLTGQIQLIVNRSLPVFLRQGETTVDLKIKQARLLRQGEGVVLNLVLDNNSTRSIFPSSELVCTKSNGEVYSHSLMALRLYKEIKQVNENLKVPAEFAKQISGCSSLSVSLKDRKDIEYKSNAIATAALNPI